MQYLGVMAIVKTIVLFIMFYLSMWAMRPIRFEKWFKVGHEKEAQLLFLFITMGVAYLASQFIFLLMDLTSQYVLLF
ncbi:DUF1146 domain-containing protein [Atopobacter phocae]|uniref:DUF1146 domain-containing protein n=1 Tax=Atopobacter phocae TaxID=136492 RepID=UPI00046F63C3|nr:DUF1146 domain-containing protein [Atopobacter phocae]